MLCQNITTSPGLLVRDFGGIWAVASYEQKIQPTRLAALSQRLSSKWVQSIGAGVVNCKEGTQQRQTLALLATWVTPST